jgi:invasion protein IalB
VKRIRFAAAAVAVAAAPVVLFASAGVSSAAQAATPTAAVSADTGGSQLNAQLNLLTQQDQNLGQDLATLTETGTRKAVA